MCLQSLCSHDLGDKDDVCNPFSPQSRLKLVFMGDGDLRCLICEGKFGQIVAVQRCSLCCYLHRLQSLLLSPEFPAAGGPVVEPDIRQVYLKVLEGADLYKRSIQGGGDPPGGEVAETSPELRELTAKSKAKPPAEEEVAAEAVEPKEEPELPNYSPDKSPEEEPPAEEEPKGKEKKRKPSDSPEKERARSSGIRRRRRSERRSRSRSRRRRRSDSRRGEPRRRSPRGKEKPERSPRGSPRRSERPPLPRRSPLRPRSPPGPPPPRSEGYRWRGPIPAHSGRGAYPTWDYSRPEPENKGVKKRKQQRLFAEFKAWRKNRDRRRR